MSNKPSRTLTFKREKCAKPVQVFLQKVSDCLHIQPYQGMCKFGEVKRHATGRRKRLPNIWHPKMIISRITIKLESCLVLVWVLCNIRENLIRRVGKVDSAI